MVGRAGLQSGICFATFRLVTHSGTAGQVTIASAKKKQLRRAASLERAFLFFRQCDGGFRCVRFMDVFRMLVLLEQFFDACCVVGVSYVGAAPKRFVVHAHLVSVSPDAVAAMHQSATPPALRRRVFLRREQVGQVAETKQFFDPGREVDQFQDAVSLSKY
jgi:hypothetical protein